MKQFTATLTERGQITIPAEVLRLLGLEPQDTVTFVVEDGRMHLLPPEYTLESAYGSVVPKHRPEDFDAMIDEAMEEHAEEVVRKLHQVR
ncbi:MAG: AbrB/MazE/SpoVT family DNA-binding domain-containing protein [Dehalococcoidia bacterium]